MGGGGFKKRLIRGVMRPYKANKKQHDKRKMGVRKNTGYFDILKKSIKYKMCI